MMVKIQGRARSFLECSPVSCKDRQEVAWFQNPRFAADEHTGSLLEKDILDQNNNILLKLQAY